MNSIFEVIFDVLYGLWINIQSIFNPIIEFISNVAQTLTPILMKFLEFIVNSINKIIGFFNWLFGLIG